MMGLDDLCLSRQCDVRQGGLISGYGMGAFPEPC
jgi:hypothetical protein